MDIAACPCFQSIVRWRPAIPQYHVGHHERVADIEKRASGYAGLFLAGNAYHGITLNDCTEQANLLASRIANFLGA